MNRGGKKRLASGRPQDALLMYEVFGVGASGNARNMALWGLAIAGDTRHECAHKRWC